MGFKFTQGKLKGRVSDGPSLSTFEYECALGGFTYQSGFLKKHIIFPGCICFPDYKNIRVEFFDPGK